MDATDTEISKQIEASSTFGPEEAQKTQRELLAKRKATGVNYWLDIAKHTNSYGQEIPNEVKWAYLLAEPVVVSNEYKKGGYRLYYIVTDQGLKALRFDYGPNMPESKAEQTLGEELKRYRYLRHVKSNKSNTEYVTDPKYVLKKEEITILPDKLVTTPGIELITTDELLNGKTEQITRVTIGSITLRNIDINLPARVIDSPSSSFFEQAVTKSESLIREIR